MYSIFIVAIVFGSIVIAIAIISGTILLSMKWRHGAVSRKGRERQAEEASMIQEIYNGLSKMEQRVESLETILMDRHGKEN
ncbi:MAG: phage-shock protein [Deltaproteobacteria bacterium]|jgi:phage shock protein B